MWLSSWSLSVLPPAVIQLLDATTGKPVTDKPFTHKCDVLELALDQHLAAAQRKLAFVDANKDLFLLTTRRVGGARKVLRLGTWPPAETPPNENVNWLVFINLCLVLIYLP